MSWSSFSTSWCKRCSRYGGGRSSCLAPRRHGLVIVILGLLLMLPIADAASAPQRTWRQLPDGDDPENSTAISSTTEMSSSTPSASQPDSYNSSSDQPSASPVSSSSTLTPTIPTTLKQTTSSPANSTPTAPTPRTSATHTNVSTLPTTEAFLTSGFGPLSSSQTTRSVSGPAVSTSLQLSSTSGSSSITSSRLIVTSTHTPVPTTMRDFGIDPGATVVTSPGFIALYVVAGLVVSTIFLACLAKCRLTRMQSAKPHTPSETGLLYTQQLSPGQRMQDQWSGNPVFNREASMTNAQRGRGDDTILEMNSSDDSDTEMTTKLDTASITVETRSNTESLPRNIIGSLQTGRPPMSLELGGPSAGSTPGGTLARDRNRRSDDEGRDGGDEEEFSGREDGSLKRFVFTRSATLDSGGRHPESRDSKKRKFAQFRSRSTTASPMHESEEDNQHLPPLPGGDVGFLRGSGRGRAGKFALLPQAVAPVLPLGAAPAPPPIPEGGFQPTLPRGAALPLTASSTSSLDTVLSDKALPVVGEEGRQRLLSGASSPGEVSPQGKDLALLMEGEEAEHSLYELVGQEAEGNGELGFVDDTYLAPADDSVIRYALIHAKQSSTSQQSAEATAPSPEGGRRSSLRRSSRHIRKTPTQQKSTGSLKRQAAAQGWRDRDTDVVTSTLPRLPYMRQSPEDKAAASASGAGANVKEQRSRSVPSTLKGDAPLSPLAFVIPAPDSASQSALSRLDESDEEPMSGSLVVMPGENMASRLQLLDQSSSSATLEEEESRSDNRLSDLATAAPRRALSALDEILRMEAPSATSAVSLRAGSSDNAVTPSKENVPSNAHDSPTKRKIGRAEQTPNHVIASQAQESVPSAPRQEGEWSMNKAESPTKSRTVSAPQLSSTAAAAFNRSSRELNFTGQSPSFSCHDTVELLPTAWRSRYNRSVPLTSFRYVQSKATSGRRDAEQYYLKRSAATMRGRSTPTFY